MKVFGISSVERCERWNFCYLFLTRSLLRVFSGGLKFHKKRFLETWRLLSAFEESRNVGGEEEEEGEERKKKRIFLSSLEKNEIIRFAKVCSWEGFFEAFGDWLLNDFGSLTLFSLPPAKFFFIRFHIKSHSQSGSWWQRNPSVEWKASQQTKVKEMATSRRLQPDQKLTRLLIFLPALLNWLARETW